MRYPARNALHSLEARLGATGISVEYTPFREMHIATAERVVTANQPHRAEHVEFFSRTAVPLHNAVKNPVLPRGASSKEMVCKVMFDPLFQKYWKPRDGPYRADAQGLHAGY